MTKYELMLISMSLSATIIAFVLFIIRRTGPNRLGHTVLYYLWLPVLLRSLLPFSFDSTLLNRIFRDYYAAATYFVKPMEFGEEGRKVIIGSNVHAPALQNPNPFTVWIILWLLVAVALLIKKITSYYAFSKYIRAGWQPVDTPKILDALGDACEKMKIRQTVNLCVNPLISTPLLLGVTKPVIVLPAVPDNPEILECTLTHELVHCKRQDVLYIWLTQLVLCVHWFNPVFYAIHRQTARDRELSCDEQVIKNRSEADRITYGRTLLETFAGKGTYQERNVTTALLENKSLLRERLEAIDSFTYLPAASFRLTVILILLVALCLIVGIYTPAG